MHEVLSYGQKCVLLGHSCARLCPPLSFNIECNQSFMPKHNAIIRPGTVAKKQNNRILKMHILLLFFVTRSSRNLDTAEFMTICSLLTVLLEEGIIFSLGHTFKLRLVTQSL